MSIGSGAAAAVIDAETMLRSFTVIALGDYELKSHTPGAVFVGGDFKADQSINGGVSNATVGGVNGTLIVGGNVTGGGQTTINGNVAIGGEITSGTTVNVNGGAVTTGADVPVAGVRAAMHGLSDSLSQLAGTAGTSFSGDSNNPRLNVGPAGADGIAVVNFDADDLGFLFGGNPGIDFSGGPVTTIINVGGESIEFGRNLNGFTGSNNVIFNFHEALEVVLNGPFAASILAPGADIWVNTGGANNFIVGNDIVQSAEVRLPFSGDLPDMTPPSSIPLPAAGWLLIAGLGALAAMARRRSA
ncbi:MAG TPA: collagen-binding domain-containing protein [Paracoccaceae bacterium]|nr:collagen-binding domain-containing protein [Paracoccaceae bacterium]